MVGDSGSITGRRAEAGRYRLLCRAVDAAGNIQPEAQHADRESYVANWIVPVEVQAVVEDEGRADEFVI